MSNGARKLAAACGIDVTALAARHTGSYLSTDDVLQAHRAASGVSRAEHVLGHNTVATYPSVAVPRPQLPGGSARRRRKSPSSWPPSSSLQTRVNAALQGETQRHAELNVLIADLASAGETEAVVRIWDFLGGAHHVTEAVWTAVERLHAKGKGRIPRGSLELPALDHASLTPERRLHKICKGRVMRARSTAASGHLESAIAWLEAERSNGRDDFLDGGGGGGTGRGARGRSALARELRAVLGVDKETARGLVTKLKQCRRL